MYTTLIVNQLYTTLIVNQLYTTLIVNQLYTHNCQMQLKFNIINTQCSPTTVIKLQDTINLHTFHLSRKFQEATNHWTPPSCFSQSAATHPFNQGIHLRTLFIHINHEPKAFLCSSFHFNFKLLPFSFVWLIDDTEFWEKWIPSFYCASLAFSSVVMITNVNAG